MIPFEQVDSVGECDTAGVVLRKYHRGITSTQKPLNNRYMMIMMNLMEMHLIEIKLKKVPMCRAPLF